MDVHVELLANPFCMADRDNETVGNICKELGVSYRLAKRTTLIGSVIYWNQRSGDSDIGRDYDRFLVNFGVRYQWEPIRL